MVEYNDDRDDILLSVNTYDTDLLDMLSRHPNWIVRCNVALNESTLTKTLDSMAYDSDDNVLNAVASSSFVSGKALEILSDSEHELTKACVAENPNTPTHILQKLVTDPVCKKWVLLNPNCPSILKVFG
jgi:hypothetical protein